MANVVKVPSSAPTSGSLGIVTSFFGPIEIRKPAEWAGLLPLVDWDPADAVTVGSNPPLLHYVPDRAGHPGRDLFSAGGSASPQFSGSYAPFNNQPVINFPVGSNKHATFTGLGIQNNGPFTMVLVGQSPRADTNAYMISLLNQALAAYSAITTKWMTGWTSADFATVADSHTGDVPFIYMQTLNGSTQRLYVNSTTESVNNSSNGGTFSGPGFIGGYAAINQDLYVWGGPVARVIIFDKELSSAERSTVLNALSTKYGITLT